MQSTQVLDSKVSTESRQQAVGDRHGGTNEDNIILNSCSNQLIQKSELMEEGRTLHSNIHHNIVVWLWREVNERNVGRLFVVAERFFRLLIRQ